MIKELLLSQLISESKWAQIVDKFTANELCSLLSYESNMTLAYDLFFKNLENFEIQDFAVRLFFSISENFREWNSEWKTDAFLGNLCSITWKYDAMYELYKKAYEKCDDPPDSLLLLLAGCNSVPGSPPITDQEAEEYLNEAVKKRETYEAAIMMRGLAKDKGFKDQELYWNNKCLELEEKNVHTEPIIPDVLTAQNRK